MAKVVGISNVVIEKLMPSPATGIEEWKKLLVTSIIYDDGRVIQQIGENADWIETKEADGQVFIIGPCKECGQPIYEDDDWEYPKDQEHLRDTQRTIWHSKKIGCPARPGDDD